VEIFLSWSGRKSKAVAEAWRVWLPKVNPAFKPWLSTADIDKGARWATDVAERLEAARAGIICLTASNLHSEWILWEAGALSKTIKNTHVCTFLIGLDPSNVKPPLSQFQATRMTKDDIFALVSTLNAKLQDRAIPSSNLPETFAVWWPKLEAELNGLAEAEYSTQPQRSERELLEEVLALVRSQSRRIETAAEAERELSRPDDLTGLLMNEVDDLNSLSIAESGERVHVRLGIKDQHYRFSFPKTLDVSTMKDAIVRHFRRGGEKNFASAQSTMGDASVLPQRAADVEEPSPEPNRRVLRKITRKQ
jgi:hypothetical protein